MSIVRVALTCFPIALALTVSEPVTARAQVVQPSRLSRASDLPTAPMPVVPQTTQPQPVPAPATQQNQTLPPKPAVMTESERQQAEEQLRKQEKQRILHGVVPDFNTVNGQNAPPLTAGQKYRLALRSSIDPFAFGAAGFLALIGQAEDSHEGYHQGIEGYAKRFGANYADSFSGTFFGNAFFPALLHQDPRYFRMGEGSIKRRMRYAVSTTIRTRTDSGHRTWNYSNVLGNIAAGGLSNLYYPAEDRGASLTFENAATVTAEGALGALGIEFYPDLARKFLHHKQRPGTSATNPSNGPQTGPPPNATPLNPDPKP